MMIRIGLISYNLVIVVVHVSFFQGEARADDYGCTMSTVSYISFVMVFITTMINVVNVAK